MNYIRPIYSKIHVEITRHEVPSTTIQQPLCGCCVGVSCRGKATSKRSTLVNPNYYWILLRKINKITAVLTAKTLSILLLSDICMPQRDKKSTKHVSPISFVSLMNFKFVLKNLTLNY